MAGGEAGTRLREALGALAEGRELGRAGARAAMEAILAGEATQAQLGAFLMGLRLRGETAAEVAGFVEAMREASLRVECRFAAAIDLCGTGGDGAGTVNISTGAALVAAAAGARVAKHGNRAASSRAGSADVLEALGVPIDLDPAAAARALAEQGFAFLFAPRYHPSMRHAAGPRRELGLRTVFNVLGPLTNPAGVRRQLLGVYSDRLRGLLAEALLALGAERVWVVHSPRAGGGGLDELGLEGPSRVSAVEGGAVRELEVTPEDAGLARRPGADLRGGDAAENARRLEAVLGGERGAVREAVLLNAAAALHLAGLAGDLREGAARAAEAIDSGRARALLEELRRRP
jgi:anthranilate phosphoribosyltransferase